MNSNRTLLVIVALLALAVLLWRTFSQAAPPESTAGANADANSSASAPAVVDVPTGTTREAKAVEASSPRVRDPALDALSLEERLAAIARTEGEIMQEGHKQELGQRLEDLLAPLLERDEQLLVVLDNLVARKWKPEGSPSDRLEIVEYGGCRATYWGVVLFHSTQGQWYDEAAGRNLFLAVLANLPSLEEPLLTTLLQQLTRANVDGKPLVARYAFEILELRAFFKEHKQLFSELFARIGESMTPEERDRFFGVYLGDPTDAVLVGASIRYLLQGTNPGAALLLAESLFDDPGASHEVRTAIAQAVVDGSPDAYGPARFLTERIDSTRNTPGLWLSLARKPDAFVAIDAEYRALLANEANPKAREMLVSAMNDAPALDLDRVAKLAHEDPDPKVRGQALLTVTSSSTWTPSSDAMENLRACYASGADPMRIAAAAGNIASKSQSAGLVDLRDDAIDFLREALDDPQASPNTKLTALESLKRFLPDAEWKSLKEKNAK